MATIVPLTAGATAAQPAPDLAQNAVRTSDTTSPAAPPTDASPLDGLSLIAAAATINAGRSLITNYVMGSDNQLAQIRLIDPATHQIIAEVPPDSIAQMQQEILAYQNLAKPRATT